MQHIELAPDHYDKLARIAKAIDWPVAIAWVQLLLYAIWFVWVLLTGGFGRWLN